MRVVAAVLAAGRGERFGGDKVTAPLGNKPVWRWSFDTFERHPLVDAVGLVVSADNREHFSDTDCAFLIEGGSDRQSSSFKAVRAADGDVVLLQDAARPFVTAEGITRVIEAISRTGAAAAAVPVSDTLRQQVGEGYEIVDRSRTVAMQTPQGGRRELLLRAHEASTQLYTDEMALLQAAGMPCEIVAGDPGNFKITTASDLDRARAMVGDVEFRTGFGYDIHPFSADPERPLMLGGVRFSGNPGLVGHSDADVVIHAAVDALLGAISLGDIGQHFPNTDPRWRGEPSSTFLSFTAGLIRERGWNVVNLDISVIAEKPKVMPRANEIRKTLADLLGIDAERVSFKATTNEGLGSLGRGEGIAAHAVATVRR